MTTQCKSLIAGAVPEDVGCETVVGASPDTPSGMLLGKIEFDKRMGRASGRLAPEFAHAEQSRFSNKEAPLTNLPVKRPRCVDGDRL